jgi:multidrug transporter EmrE-like cation transporter
MSFHWLILLAAIAVEIVATAALKSFVSAPLLVAILPLLLIGLSFALLSVALRVIPLAVAYAVWEGSASSALPSPGIGSSAST